MAGRFERKLRHLLAPLVRKLETTAHPLRYLFVEITQRCNLRCRHCGSDCTRDTRLAELSCEEWLGFFGSLGEKFDTRKLVLVITGGEPLCHPELDRILSGLRERRLAFGMVTNGMALTPRVLARALECGLSSLTVSLDGLAENHDWLRGQRGAFERAVAATRLAAGAGLPFFDVVTCVHPRNLPELPRVLSLLRELQVPAWRLFSIFPKGRAARDPELQLAPPGFRELLGFIQEQREASRAKGDAFSIQFSCEGYLPADLDRQVRDQPYFCRAGINVGSVLCDGAISACPNISRALVQGNIRIDDLAEVWEKKFQPFRDRSWLKTGKCADCQEWGRCLGNSLHLYDEKIGGPTCCTYEMVR